MLLRMVRSWTALATICGMLYVLPVNADSESHNIPAHLLECYQNQTLYHRENRLPATMPLVISLLQQIEEYPGFTMDARSFALSLLHMFRVDGIERDPEVIATEHTIPFGLTGQQYFKHSVVLKNLIPRSSFLFPNESISIVEKCSLHFMLSNSLDKVQRGDESKTCNSIASYAASGRYRRAANFDADEDEDIFTEEPVISEDDVAAATSDDDFEAESVKVENPSLLDSDVASTDAPAPNGEAPVAAAAAAARAMAAPSQQDQPAADAPAPSTDDPDAEIVVQPGQLDAAGNASGAAAKKGNLMWGADGEGPVNWGQMRAGPALGVERQLYVNSECPVENGVVYTQWGSVQLGTLLAGIAAGFETQLVAVKDINAGSRTISGLSDSLVVDNRYAVTLAGDMAEVALTRGPRNTVKVGASGNWNSTADQHWYFINKVNEMTDAEIRGGLDGLIIAHHVKDWANKAEGSLRLSSILERYYSKRGVFDQEYRACQRQDHYKEVATSDTLKEQTTSFASALYDATPSTPMITSTGLSSFAADAVEALDKTVRASSQMETNCESSTRPDTTSTTAYPEPKLNLIFVVDCQWSYDYIKPALQSLAENINLHPYGSNITVIGAATHEVLFNTSNRVTSFSGNLNKNKTQYQQCTQGMKLNDLLEKYLWNYFTYQLENEKANKESSVRSNVVVLMPYVSYDIQPSELTEVENRLKEYRKYFPDVTFLFFASSKKDSFKILVEDYDKDIIEFSYTVGKSIDILDLVNRLTTVPRRIANPTCGSSWKESKYETVRIYETIPFNHIAYYRIHPKYLFGIGSEAIKIREQNKGTVTICYSRTDSTPQNDDDDDDDSDEKNDNQCESVSGSEVEIKLSNPCSGSSSYQSCDPLYISIEVTETKFKCGEIATCKSADDGAVEIAHNNLTCGGAALRSSITLAVAVFLIISKILFTG